MNKKVLILIVALAVVVAGAVVYWKVLDTGESGGGGNALVPAAAADIYEEENRLEVMKGSVTVSRASGEEEEITDETTVNVGDTIQVGPGSRATLYWFDHSVSRLAPNTEITIDQAAYDPENINETDINFEVVSGEVWSKVQAIVDEDSEFLSYSGNVVAGVRGTVYNLEVREDEVVVETIAHALTVGEETLVKGEQAGFEKESGATKFKEKMPDDIWERPWFTENLEHDKADEMRMRAAMMEKMRNVLGVLPGEPGFDEALERIEAFMRSDASPAEKEAMRATLTALLRAMNVTPDDDRFKTKLMLQDKLIEWTEDEEKRAYLERMKTERRLYDLQDWMQYGEPEPQALEDYVSRYADLMEQQKAFFEANPELMQMIQDSLRRLQTQLPELMNDPEFQRFMEMMENGEIQFPDRFDPIIDPEIYTQPVLQNPPATTEPTETIIREAPYYQGESNV